MPNNDKPVILSREDIENRIKWVSDPQAKAIGKSHLAALDEIQTLQARQLPEGWEHTSTRLPEESCKCLFWVSYNNQDIVPVVSGSFCRSEVTFKHKYTHYSPEDVLFWREEIPMTRTPQQIKTQLEYHAKSGEAESTIDRNTLYGDALRLIEKLEKDAKRKERGR